MSVLLKPLEENERRLIMIDAILAAINIDTELELQQLIQAVKDIGVIKEWPNKNDPNLVYKGIIQYLQSRAGREKRNSSMTHYPNLHDSSMINRYRRFVRWNKKKLELLG